MATDEINDAVMGASEVLFGKDGVAAGGEIAVGEKQKFDALAQVFVAQEQRIDDTFWLGHVASTQGR